jgi:hypothetical protein
MNEKEEVNIRVDGGEQERESNETYMFDTCRIISFDIDASFDVFWSNYRVDQEFLRSSFRIQILLHQTSDNFSFTTRLHKNTIKKEAKTQTLNSASGTF